MTDLLRIAIADDEPLARLRLQQLCEDVHEHCPNVVCAMYEHGQALVNAMPLWTPMNAPDVLLLDINMPGLSGVEIAAYLKAQVPTVAIIFVTAEPEHALAAFDVAASDYVLKPVRAERLSAALKKVVKTAAPQTKASVEHTLLVVNDGGTSVSLPLAQVLYFKSDNKQTVVRTLDRHYTCLQSLAEIESALTPMSNMPPSDSPHASLASLASLASHASHTFIRIHRNALLRRSAVGALHQGEALEVQVLGVPERLHISRRLLPSLRADLNAAPH
jgi:two-component system, LytTR family, response regulator AlgR